MLKSLLFRLYLAAVTAAITLCLFSFVDQKWFDGQMFPYPQPNGWTWSLWITGGLALAPWIFAWLVLLTEQALDSTIGVPSRMQAQPAPARAHRKVVPFRQVRQ